MSSCRRGAIRDSGLSGDFERDFSSVLDPAASYGEIVHSGVASVHPPDAFVNQVPESTVWRLHLAATAASRPPSSVFALGTPRSATHRRGRSPGRVGTPRLHRRQTPMSAHRPLRAIRCELGVHQEWEDSAHGAR